MRADRLKKLREATRLTQEEMAERLDISLRRYSDYENEKGDPPGEVLVRMAAFFNVTADYLLGNEPITEESLTPAERRLIFALRNGLTIEALKAVVELSKGADHDSVDTTAAIHS